MTRPYIFDSGYTVLPVEEAGFVVTASRGNDDAFGLERVGKMTVSMEPVGSWKNTGFAASMTRTGEMAFWLVRFGGLSGVVKRVAGMNVKMILVDSEEPHYLEIEPEIAWVVNGWTSNDVVSDLTWIVD